MYANYQLNEKDMDISFLNAIKDTFKGKEIEISIAEIDETEYLLRSPQNRDILMERIKDVSDNKNLQIISADSLNDLL
jgi:antitoxin YefM